MKSDRADRGTRALETGRLRKCGETGTRPDPGHRYVAKAFVSSGTAQEAKAIAGDLRGFRAMQVRVVLQPAASAATKPGLSPEDRCRSRLRPAHYCLAGERERHRHESFSAALDSRERAASLGNWLRRSQSRSMRTGMATLLTRGGPAAVSASSDFLPTMT
jgi:hypothetical protein